MVLGSNPSGPTIHTPWYYYMAQYKTDSQEYTSNGGSTFETQLLATKNGQVIDESNPLPVTLAVNVNMNDLLDVDTSGVIDGSILVYDDSIDEWTIGSLSSGGSSLSADNTTVDITSDTISVIDLPNTGIGPIQSLQFDPTHEDSGTEPVGTMCWDSADETMHIYHPNGVVQQVGQEQYAYVRNNTGTVIPNGTVVRFDGAEAPNGEARVEVAPLLADGAQPGLYTIGVSTGDIADGADGRITIFGKVREINTTGSDVGETWAVGDILYVSPDNAGNFTKVKPTAPNNVTPIAAVLRADATDGELFVRPTIEQKESYGKFARITDFTFDALDTPYALDYDTTEITNGATLGTGDSVITVDQSGFYQVDINLQADATGGGFSSAVLYTWIRVNGVDLDNSTRRQGILGSAPSSTFSYTLGISLAAEDELEIMVAASSTNLALDSAAATSFAPATASALVSVTQVQL